MAGLIRVVSSSRIPVCETASTLSSYEAGTVDLRIS